MMSKDELHNTLEDLLDFLKPVKDLANSHFASVFSEDLWYKNVPEKIHQELFGVEKIKEFILMYSDIVKSKCPKEYYIKNPNLTSYIKNAASLSIMNDNKYLKHLVDLENTFLLRGYQGHSDFKLEEFMSSKKLHEVKKLSRITAFLKNVTKSSHVVDIGGGKGYLSSVLALHHYFKVLGLDSSEITTCGAIKRSEKVARLWNQSENSKLSENFIKKHYKQVTTFVKPQTNVIKLVEESFNEEIDGVTLTGLHTCGDLAVTSLKIFVNNDKIKAIANVGCCYHLLTEKFLEEKEEMKIDDNDFPLSKFLKEKNFKLGRNARMLASHSLERYNAKSELEEFSQTSLFYRAILETILVKDNIGDNVQVKRLAKKCSTFHEYIRKASKKLNINFQMTDSDLEELYTSFLDKKPLLTAFFLLRVTLAPIIESIILLDRILYLIENDIYNAYLVRVFDLEISPRGFGIIAWKDFKNS